MQYCPEKVPMKKILSISAMVFLLLVCIAGAVRAYYTGFHHELRWWVTEWTDGIERPEDAIWLSDYTVQTEGLAIAGLTDDISALTFDPDRKTLFAVTNGNPHIVELSLDGRLLRSIRLEGFIDPEAIEYMQKNVYVITDERDQRLVKVRIDDDTNSVHARDFQQLSLGIGLNGNKGFEGLAYDHSGKRLFVAKERDPVRIYEIKGFPHMEEGKPMVVNIVDDPERNAGLFVSDLSSLQYDEQSGHLLALSDQSHLILELDVTGWPISKLSLKAGQHGLKKTVPQAEGVAMDNAGTLYLVSEPNLFYVFKRKSHVL
jgi:uncharacterized protein YjiK